MPDKESWFKDLFIDEVSGALKPAQAVEVISSDYLTDVVTGKKHRIQVIDGKLTMTEVSE